MYDSVFGSFCWSGSRVLIFSNPAKTFITSPLNCTYYLFGHFNILLSVTVLKHKSKIIISNHIKSNVINTNIFAKYLGISELPVLV